MKNLMLSLALVLVTEHAAGQKPLMRPAVKVHQFFLHYYPSDMIAGNIAFGLEHLYKKRLSQEFSFAIRSFPTTQDYYNKGYRLDYLIKYNLYTGKIFRFSSNLSFTYKDIYYTNRPAEYSYQDASGALTSQPHVVTLEDRRLKEFGFGLGVSLNFRVFKKLFVGTDITFNRVDYALSYNEKEVIYGTPYGFTNNSGAYVVPYVRLKISYLLGKQ